MSLVEEHLIGLLGEAKARKHHAKIDSDYALSRLVQYREIEATKDREIDEITNALDATFPGWKEQDA